jgi:hypothetical protein
MKVFSYVSDCYLSQVSKVFSYVSNCYLSQASKVFSYVSDCYLKSGLQSLQLCQRLLAKAKLAKSSAMSVIVI